MRPLVTPLHSVNGALAPRLDSFAPTLSVIVPTRNEVESIDAFLTTSTRALRETSAEIIVVDDSDDSTPEVVRSASRANGAIRLVHRERADRQGGLGTAVAQGFKQATGQFVAVIDADLQHPPTVLPTMVELAKRTDAELVIGSRYVCGGNAVGFSPVRQVASIGAGALARALFPRRLARITDPMSGLFLLRRDALNVDGLRPDGFKILLEILVRNPGLRIVEVPYTFGSRQAGESKASAAEARRYLSALVRLRLHTISSPSNQEPQS